MKVTAGDLLSRHSILESDRCNFEALWQRSASLVLPNQALFQRQQPQQGERRDNEQFDSTGALAVERFSAAMESSLTPRTQQWAELGPAESELAKDLTIRRYCEEVNDTLFRYRYAATAGFTTASGEHYQSLGAFGNGCTMVMESAARNGLRYQAQFLGEMYIALNFQGEIDTAHRCFEYTARQAFQLFGDGPRGYFRETMERRPDTKLEFLHCVKPNEEYDPTKAAKRRPFASYYICKTIQEIVEEGGYFTMPYVFSRFSTAPRETYGRGPTQTVLNTLNTANEMAKTLLRAGQKAVDPPLLLPDDDILRGFNLRSGALNYGGVDSMGNARVQPLATGANMPLGLEMQEAERRIINDAFYVTLFQVLVDSPTMTATEALLRAQEKGALIAPPMGRQQTEYLGPMIAREIDILERAGLLPPPPPQLVEAGGELKIEYTAPLNRLQKAEKGVAISRTLEALAPVAQVNPKVYDRFNMSNIAKTMGEVNGVPADCMYTDDEMKEIEGQNNERQELGDVLEAAPIAGKVALDLSKAASLSQNAVAPVLQ
jgi:hypothetical protein